MVELGPGRGTLMRDALRAGRALPGFLSAVSVHLVEVSAPMRQLQRAALLPAGAGDGAPRERTATVAGFVPGIDGFARPGLAAAARPERFAGGWRAGIGPFRSRELTR